MDDQELQHHMDDQELQHHGVKGMKWGVRRTSKQLGHKTSSSKKKKSSSDGPVKKVADSIKKFKKKRAAEKRAENARKAKLSKEEFEAAKKKAIESGTAEDVLKFKGKLSNAELSAAVNRINMEQQLSQIQAKTVKTGMDKAENFMNKVDRVKGMAEKGISAWNVYAKIHNSLSDNDVPVIDGNFKDRKAAKAEKAAKKAEEKAAKARRKLVESGTPEEIAKNFGKFTASELKDATSRLAYEDKIRERLPKKKAYTAPEMAKITLDPKGKTVSDGSGFVAGLFPDNEIYNRGRKERD